MKRCWCLVCSLWRNINNIFYIIYAFNDINVVGNSRLFPVVDPSKTSGLLWCQLYTQCIYEDINLYSYFNEIRIFNYITTYFSWDDSAQRTNPSLSNINMQSAMKSECWWRRWSSLCEQDRPAVYSVLNLQKLIA